MTDITSIALDMNLPLTGLAFALVAIFLRVNSPRGDILMKLSRMDWMFVLFPCRVITASNESVYAVETASLSRALRPSSSGLRGVAFATRGSQPTSSSL